MNEAAAVLTRTLQGIADDYQHLFAGVRGRGLMQGMLLSREYAGQAKEMARVAEAE